MTRHRHLKDRIRSRMARTAESYTTARRHVLAQRPEAAPLPTGPVHFAATDPATAALRILLANADIVAPHTGGPFTEAMVLGIAGGIGAGVFAFHYPAENFSSFFLAGRHLWQDHEAYLRGACERLGVPIEVRETGGAAAARKNLADLLASGRPAIAWLDKAHLPHHGLPASASGGGYHVVAVYRLDENRDIATIADATDEPIVVSLEDLAHARARIASYRHRVLAIAPASASADLPTAIRAGLHACHAGIVSNRNAAFTLKAFATCAERMRGGGGKNSWEVVFPPGGRLFDALVSLYGCIEHHGSGGGLMRFMFADFLGEAADAIDDPRLATLSERYETLGRQWSDLARTALPDDLPPFRSARDLTDRRAELLHSGADDGSGIRDVLAKLADIRAGVHDVFPLDAGAGVDLRNRLSTMLFDLHAAEVAAHQALGAALR